MGLGDADESLRLGLRETPPEISYSHAGIDHDRNGTDFEKSKREREKLGTWRRHQDRPHASADANARQAMSQPVAFFIKLLVGKLGTLSARDNDGCLSRLPLGHRGQMSGNIDKGCVGHNGQIPPIPESYRMIMAPTRNAYYFFASGKI